MQRWHWMALGVVVWLGLGAFGVRWLLRPYQWVLVGDLCGCKDLERLRADFPVHLATFPTSLANQADDAEGMDLALVDWAWHESIARFAILFFLWMGAGWLLHWSVSRLAREGSG
jgi:hypothetical protein